MGFFDGLEQKMKNASEVSNLNSQIRENEKLIEQYYHDLGKLYFEKYGKSPSPETEGVCKAILSCIDSIDDLKKQVVVAKGLKLCSSCGAECPIEVPFCSSCGSKLPMPEPPAKEETAQVCFCSSCGHKLEADAAFCPSCGNPVAKVAPTAAVSNEVQEIPMEESFETEAPAIQEPVITSPVVEEPAEVAPIAETVAIENPVVETVMIEEPVTVAPVAEPVAVEESIPEGMKKCASCGALVIEKALFCGTCGSKF